MIFLVQKNIHKDPDHYKIFEALEELNIDFESIELKQNQKNLDVKTERNDVFVYGSVALAKIAKQKFHWNPGSFYGGNHLYETYSKFYGQHLINSEVTIKKVSDDLMWNSNEKKFIKPHEEAKIFTGKVFTEKEWKEFVYEAFNSENKRISKNSLIQISNVKHIHKEARLWIVDGVIVDAGYYYFDENIAFEEVVSPEGIEFAKQMLNIYQVEKAFVMDICLTHEGWKIVEINCINSSGFYPNTNVKAIVKALQVYFSE